MQARLNLRAPKLIADHASPDPHVGAIAAKRSEVGGPAPVKVESDHRFSALRIAVVVTRAYELATARE